MSMKAKMMARRKYQRMLSIEEEALMKMLTSLIGLAFILSVIMAAQGIAFEKEAAAWGLPEGFNPETGKIEKQAEQTHKSSDLIGTVALNDRGERLGTVEEILFSDDGRIEYLILARRDFDGRERLVPIPWKDAKAEISGDTLVLSLDKETFANAPSFARNDWGRLDDPDWNKSVHSYY
jgi:sporulation protein YlmC with PRC-barrel domain